MLFFPLIVELCNLIADRLCEFVEQRQVRFVQNGQLIDQVLHARVLGPAVVRDRRDQSDDLCQLRAVHTSDRLPVGSFLRRSLIFLDFNQLFVLFLLCPRKLHELLQQLEPDVHVVQRYRRVL